MAKVKLYPQVDYEYEDRDPREAGRVIRLVAIVPDIDDGYGGPVFDAVCIENKVARKVGRKTQVGAHGLHRRWRLRENDQPIGKPPSAGGPYNDQGIPL